MDAMTVLVTILGVILGIFLLLSIAAIVMVIRVLRDIKEITARAEHTTEELANVSKLLRKNIAPAAVVTTIVKYFKQAKNKFQE